MAKVFQEAGGQEMGFFCDTCSMKNRLFNSHFK